MNLGSKKDFSNKNKLQKKDKNMKNENEEVFDNIYNLLQKLLDETKSSTKTLLELKNQKLDTNVTTQTDESNPNEKLIEILNTHSNNFESLTKKIDKINSTEIPQELHQHHNNQIDKHYSIFGKGEKVNVMNLLYFISAGFFVYFTIVFLISFYSDYDSKSEKLRVYETFYNYHYHNKILEKDTARIEYLENILNKISTNAPDFVEEFDYIEKEYNKAVKEYQLKKELKELQNDSEK